MENEKLKELSERKKKVIQEFLEQTGNIWCESTEYKKEFDPNNLITLHNKKAIANNFESAYGIFMILENAGLTVSEAQDLLSEIANSLLDVSKVKLV